MSELEICKTCGVPRMISTVFSWGDNGVISISHSPKARMAFYESGNIDNIFRGTLGYPSLAHPDHPQPVLRDLFLRGHAGDGRGIRAEGYARQVREGMGRHLSCIHRSRRASHRTRG